MAKSRLRFFVERNPKKAARAAFGGSEDLMRSRLMRLNKRERARVIWRMASQAPTLDALEAIYRSRAADFYRFAVARTGDPEVARDAVQEGFARAIRSRRTFRGSGSLEAWVCRCVLNAAIDATPPSVGGDAVGEPEVGEVDPEVDHVVRTALRALPERQRDAVFLRFYLDLDYAAIAYALGVQVGTVSATLHAAHKHLSRALTEEVRR